jgi:polyisoprenoid-binding protein YceI
LKKKPMATKINWAIDPMHSEINFKVKHLAIASVSGNFRGFRGTVISETEDFDQAEIHFEADTNTIDTNNTERDAHLRSDMFLNAGKFPRLAFSGRIGKTGDAYQLQGKLTLLETAKAVRLDLEYNGTAEGRFNDVRAGFEVSGKINRKDFGLTFNLLTGAGDLVVGEEIRLHCDIELIRQPNPA